ncbi:MAG: energy-coupling factor transporter transmembrane component T [Chloroflexota bacterium]
MRPFRYVPGSSFLHRLNPSIKLLAVALVTIAITFVFDIATPLVFLAACLLLIIVVGRLSPGYVLVSMAPFILIGLSFVFLYSIFGPGTGTNTIVAIGPVKVSREGIELGISVGLRVLFLVSTSLLFVATTDPSDFVLSLIQQARINYKLAFALLAAFRFIPIFAEEYANIRAAARVRGVGTGGNPLAAIKALRTNAVPLLAGAIRRAERLALAMDSRAFGAYPDRTYHKRLTVTGADWFFLGSVVVASAAIFAVLAYTGLLRGAGNQF